VNLPSYGHARGALDPPAASRCVGPRRGADLAITRRRSSRATGFCWGASPTRRRSYLYSGLLASPNRRLDSFAGSTATFDPRRGSRAAVSSGMNMCPITSPGPGGAIFVAGNVFHVVPAFTRGVRGRELQGDPPPQPSAPSVAAASPAPTSCPRSPLPARTFLAAALLPRHGRE